MVLLRSPPLEKEEVKHSSVLKVFRLIPYRKLNSPIKQPGLDIPWHMRPVFLQLPVNRSKPTHTEDGAAQNPHCSLNYLRRGEKSSWKLKKGSPKWCLEKAPGAGCTLSGADQQRLNAGAAVN